MLALRKKAPHIDSIEEVLASRCGGQRTAALSALVQGPGRIGARECRDVIVVYFLSYFSQHECVVVGGRGGDEDDPRQ